MTKQELIKQIEETAQYCYSQGQYVKINHGLPWVEVHRGNDDTYFLQGEEASNLLDEVPDCVNEEDYIMWNSQGW